MPGTEKTRSRMGVEGPARPLDFVFILRPAVIVPLWIFFAQGARLPSQSGWAFRIVVLPSAVEWMALASITGILAGAYLLNQLLDIETDRLNDKLFFLPRGIISVRAAWIELVIIWCGAAGLASALSLASRWAALAAFAFSVTYSAPPVRAKSRVGLDVLWNAIGFGLAGTLAGLTTVTSAAAAGSWGGAGALGAVGGWGAEIARGVEAW
ncbi:UbiA family prenyltransferase, partial [bacterium]|nr:UbiA family prenyltransferase [bacterium]